LQDKVYNLEQSLTQVIKDFDQERQQLKDQNKQEQREQGYLIVKCDMCCYLDWCSAELTAVRRSLELLKRENRHLRHLGRKILQQV